MTRASPVRGRRRKVRRYFGCALASGLIFLLTGPNAGLAGAQAQAKLVYSADMSANIASDAVYAARRDYVIDSPGSGGTVVSIPGVPDRANLRDFHIDPDGAVLFCLDIGAALGGVYFRAGDVIRFADSQFDKAFDATAAGVPWGIGCDGVTRWGNAGDLLLSFDQLFTTAALTVRPAEAAVWNGALFAGKPFDAAELGLNASLNVDAIDAVGTVTDLWLSFDTGGSAGGVIFADEDVVHLQLADPGWSKPHTLLSLSDRWGAADLDGLFANDDVIFSNGFEEE